MVGALLAASCSGRNSRRRRPDANLTRSAGTPSNQFCQLPVAWRTPQQELMILFGVSRSNHQGKESPLHSALPFTPSHNTQCGSLTIRGLCDALYVSISEQLVGLCGDGGGGG